MKTGPAEFVRQVKNEGKKVTWPTKQETGKAVLMIFIVTCVMSLFVFGADWAISSLVKLALDMGIKV